jgi:uncharacterized protein (DUF1697 family)
MVYVALLRGVNVGGNKIISMAKLKISFEKLGFTNVQTYINSGNVIFQSSETDPRKLEKKIEKALVKNHKLDSKVILRSFPEMARVVNDIPKDWKDDKKYRYNIMFLSHAVDIKKLKNELIPKPGIEKLVIKQGVLFWSAIFAKITQSNMLKVNRLPLYKEMTIRNPNSTRKIYEMMLSSK